MGCFCCREVLQCLCEGCLLGSIPIPIPILIPIPPHTAGRLLLTCLPACPMDALWMGWKAGKEQPRGTAHGLRRGAAKHCSRMHQNGIFHEQNGFNLLIPRWAGPWMGTGELKGPFGCFHPMVELDEGMAVERSGDVLLLSPQLCLCH